MVHLSISQSNISKKTTVLLTLALSAITVIVAKLWHSPAICLKFCGPFLLKSSGHIPLTLVQYTTQVGMLHCRQIPCRVGWFPGLLLVWRLSSCFLESCFCCLKYSIFSWKNEWLNPGKVRLYTACCTLFITQENGPHMQSLKPVIGSVQVSKHAHCGHNGQLGVLFWILNVHAQWCISLHHWVNLMTADDSWLSCVFVLVCLRLALQRLWPPLRRAMWMKWLRGESTMETRSLELSGTSTLPRTLKRSENCSARSAANRFLTMISQAMIFIGFTPQNQSQFAKTVGN